MLRVVPPVSDAPPPPPAALLTRAEYESLGALPPTAPAREAAVDAALLAGTAWVEQATGRTLAVGTIFDPDDTGAYQTGHERLLDGITALRWRGPLADPSALRLPAGFFSAAFAAAAAVLAPDGTEESVASGADEFAQFFSWPEPRVLRSAGFSVPAGCILRVSGHLEGIPGGVGNSPPPPAVLSQAKIVVAAWARGALEYGSFGAPWRPNAAEQSILNALRLPAPDEVPE